MLNLFKKSRKQRILDGEDPILVVEETLTKEEKSSPWFSMMWSDARKHSFAFRILCSEVGANLSNIKNFCDATIEDMTIQDVDFSDSNISRFDFEYVLFKNCNFRRFEFRDGNFTNCRFENCDLSYSHMNRIQLLEDNVFDGSDLSSSSFSFFKPRVYSPALYRLIFNQCNMDFSNIDFSNFHGELHFKNTGFKGSRLRGNTSIRQASFREVTFDNTFISKDLIFDQIADLHFFGSTPRFRAIMLSSKYDYPVYICDDYINIFGLTYKANEWKQYKDKWCVDEDSVNFIEEYLDMILYICEKC